jgi:hypothetical protein
LARRPPIYVVALGKGEGTEFFHLGAIDVGTMGLQLGSISPGALVCNTFMLAGVELTIRSHIGISTRIEVNDNVHLCMCPDVGETSLRTPTGIAGYEANWH